MVSWILGLSGVILASFYVFEVVMAFAFPADLASIWNKVDSSHPNYSPEAVRWLAVVRMPTTFIYIFSALAAWKAFNLIAVQSGISRTASIWLRRAGLGFAVVVLIEPFISYIFAIVLVFAHVALPDVNVKVSFGAAEIKSLLMSFMMFILAHVMTLADDIDRDNKLIV